MSWVRPCNTESCTVLRCAALLSLHEQSMCAGGNDFQQAMGKVGHQWRQKMGDVLPPLPGVVPEQLQGFANGHAAQVSMPARPCCRALPHRRRSEQPWPGACGSDHT